MDGCEILPQKDGGNMWKPFTRHGKHTKNYGQISMFHGETQFFDRAIFRSYVKLPADKFPWDVYQLSAGAEFRNHQPYQHHWNDVFLG